MQIKRRNTERLHAFVEEVERDCGIYSLQGLLLDEHWEPTTAIEAYEFTGCVGDLLLDGVGISAQELYVKCVFAERIGVPLYVIAHSENAPHINIYLFQADHAARVPRCVQVRKKTPQEFVAWWREQKKTQQTKLYREDMTRRMEDSYFDTVLEEAGEKWGGNIDGFLVSWDSGDAQIVGIVENRVTSRVPLRQYDPQKFFRNNGGDYHTWLPLITLRDRLGIPLFLATYSNQPEETHLAGLTRVEALDRDTGLTYLKKPNGREQRPFENILSSTAAIRQWFQTHLQ